MSQFADDSMTPPPIAVKRDKFENEIPVDRPMHPETTAGEGAFNFSGNQYDDGPSKGGFSSYGVEVKDAGQQASRITVNVGNAGRGQES
jgi:hypothetical protein